MMHSQDIVDQWDRGSAIDALKRGCQAEPPVSYSTLFREGRSLRSLVTRACRQAVRLATDDNDVTQRWTELLKMAATPWPRALVDRVQDDVDSRDNRTLFKLQRYRMICAHLLCTRERLRITQGWSEEPQLFEVAGRIAEELNSMTRAAAEAQELNSMTRAAAEVVRDPSASSKMSPLEFVQHCPVSAGQIAALMLALFSRDEELLTNPSCSLRVLLVDTRDAAGVPATLELKLRSAKGEIAYPAPSCSWVCVDGTFAETVQHACDFVKTTGLWQPNQHVCWGVSLGEEQGADGGTRYLESLTGPSMSAAIALGMCRLFAQLPQGQRTFGLPRPFNLLPLLDLWDIALTAQVSADGGLRHVNGLPEKLVGLAHNNKTVARPTRWVLVAKNHDLSELLKAHFQPEGSDILTSPDQDLHILSVSNLEEAIEKIHEHCGPLDSVRRYAREQWGTAGVAPALFPRRWHLSPATPIPKEVPQSFTLDVSLLSPGSIPEHAHDDVPRLAVVLTHGAIDEFLSHAVQGFITPTWGAFSASACVPIVIDVARWKGRTAREEQWLLTHFEQHSERMLSPGRPTSKHWMHWLSEGRVALLFKGLEGVRKNAVPGMIDCVVKVSKAFPRCPIVLVWHERLSFSKPPEFAFMKATSVSVTRPRTISVTADREVRGFFESLVSSGLLQRVMLDVAETDELSVSSIDGGEKSILYVYHKQVGAPRGGYLFLQSGPRAFTDVKNRLALMNRLGMRPPWGVSTRVICWLPQEYPDSPNHVDPRVERQPRPDTGPDLHACPLYGLSLGGLTASSVCMLLEYVVRDSTTPGHLRTLVDDILGPISQARSSAGETAQIRGPLLPHRVHLTADYVAVVSQVARHPPNIVAQGFAMSERPRVVHMGTSGSQVYLWWEGEKGPVTCAVCPATDVIRSELLLLVARDEATVDVSWRFGPIAHDGSATSAATVKPESALDSIRGRITRAAASLQDEDRRKAFETAAIQLKPFDYLPCPEILRGLVHGGLRLRNIAVEGSGQPDSPGALWFLDCSSVRTDAPVLVDHVALEASVWYELVLGRRTRRRSAAVSARAARMFTLVSVFTSFGRFEIAGLSERSFLKDKQLRAAVVLIMHIRRRAYLQDSSLAKRQDAFRIYNGLLYNELLHQLHITHGSSDPDRDVEMGLLLSMVGAIGRGDGTGDPWTALDHVVQELTGITIVHYMKSRLCDVLGSAIDVLKQETVEHDWEDPVATRTGFLYALRFLDKQGLARPGYCLPLTVAPTPDIVSRLTCLRSLLIRRAARAHGIVDDEIKDGRWCQSKRLRSNFRAELAIKRSADLTKAAVKLVDPQATQRAQGQCGHLSEFVASAHRIGVAGLPGGGKSWGLALIVQERFKELVDRRALTPCWICAYMSVAEYLRALPSGLDEPSRPQLSPFGYELLSSHDLFGRLCSSKDLVAWLLEVGAFQFVLDGLNEVQLEERVRFARHLTRLCAAYPHLRVVVACRKGQWDESTHTTGLDRLLDCVVDVRPFSQDEVADFITTYFRGHSIALGLSLLKCLDSDPTLWDLATNPFLLDKIISLWEKEGTSSVSHKLPSNRGDLLYAYIQSLRAEQNVADRFGLQHWALSILGLHHVCLDATDVPLAEARGLLLAALCVAPPDCFSNGRKPPGLERVFAPELAWLSPEQLIALTRPRKLATKYGVAAPPQDGRDPASALTAEQVFRRLARLAKAPRREWQSAWVAAEKELQSLEDDIPKVGLYDLITHTSGFMHHLFQEYFAAKRIATLLKNSTTPAGQLSIPDWMRYTHYQVSLGILIGCILHKEKQGDLAREILRCMIEEGSRFDDVRKCLATADNIEDKAQSLVKELVAKCVEARAAPDSLRAEAIGCLWYLGSPLEEARHLLERTDLEEGREMWKALLSLAAGIKT